MEGRFGYVVLTARYFYVTALVHLTKDFDDLIYSVSFLFHVSGRVLPARVSFSMAQFSEVRSLELQLFRLVEVAGVEIVTLFYYPNKKEH